MSKSVKAPVKRVKQTQEPEIDDEAARKEYEEAKAWLAQQTPRDIVTADFFDAAKLDLFKQQFAENQPFPHLSIPNFVDDRFLKMVLEELQTLDYVAKDNDLYSFTQSELDLKAVKTNLISKLREVLYSPEVVQALSHISGIDLYTLDHESKPDLFAAVYEDTSRLLCHDDELEGRRIAFILYLVPEDWSQEDGGHLDLFYQDSTCETPTPSHRVKALLPKWATFNFFEVSEKSFHQVREVLAANKKRVSIGGWFHGPRLRRNPVHVEHLPLALPPVDMSKSLSYAPEGVPVMEPAVEVPKDSEDVTSLDFWINRTYRRPPNVKQAAEKFGEDSSIELNSFLRVDRYKELCAELLALERDAFSQSNDAESKMELAESKTGCDDLSTSHPQAKPGSAFTLVGPPNLRTYYRCHASDSTDYTSDSVKSAVEAVLAIHSGESKSSTCVASGDTTAEDDALPAGGGLAAAKMKELRLPSTPSLLPPTSRVRQFQAFLRSPQFFKFIQSVTSCTPLTSSSELRLYRDGCYTLSHDFDLENWAEGLDVIFTLVPVEGKWRTDHGGSRHYLKEGEDEELLTVFPSGNSLCLVYRNGLPPEQLAPAKVVKAKAPGKGILQFTRFVNHNAPCGLFHFHNIMRLAPDSDDDGDGDEGEDEVEYKPAEVSAAQDAKKKKAAALAAVKKKAAAAAAAAKAKKGK